MEDLEIAARREPARSRCAGESPLAIERELGRTRQWVAPWAARYDPHDRSWAEGRSRAPKPVANRTAASVEAQVLEGERAWRRARGRRSPSPAIAWELEKLGAVLPPMRTIEQILMRAGATGASVWLGGRARGIP
jgi:hypothetical protein